MASELYGIAYILAVIVSIAMAAFVFPLWRRYRHRFLLLFGITALLDIFRAAVDLYSQRQPLSDAEYAAALQVVYILHIIGTLVFGAGLLLLVRHVRSAGVPTWFSRSDATRNV